MSASDRFWAAAKIHLAHIGQDDPWERLQALTLLAHYSFLNPNIINTSNCAAAAIRICLQLGLHGELPITEQTSLGQQAVNARRRLFWATYSLNA